MTLSEIKTAVASYLHRAPTELTVNGVDLGLVALNHVRQFAELHNDFGFTRKLLQVSVDGVTGGSLDGAIEYGQDDDQTYNIKTLLDVGQFDSDGNLRPVEWSTVGDSLNRERADSPYAAVRSPTDAQALCNPVGQRRFTFVGDKVYYFPKTADTTFTLGLEAYTFTPDWTSVVNTPASQWLIKGSMYLQWAAIVHINNLFKDFVFRQEGNLPPPEKLAESALDAFITWDTFKYEQFRRHDR